MKKNKVVVTGGAGFIGSNLSRALLVKGFEVHIVDNLAASKKENVPQGAIFHEVDIRNGKDLAPIFKDAKTVFHLAALPRVQYSIENPALTHDVNVTGTLNVLVAAKDAGVGRVIFSSSAAVYGDQEVMPLRENMPALPQSPYGVHKYMGELYCAMFSRLYNVQTVCLRYFNVYGAGQSADGSYPLVVAKFFDLKKQGKPLTITGDGKQTRDYVNVLDIARANILAMESDKVGNAEIINIGAGVNHSVNDVAKLIGGPIEYIPARLEPKNVYANASLAKQLLDWTLSISLEEGIKQLQNSTKPL